MFLFYLEIVKRITKYLLSLLESKGEIVFSVGGIQRVPVKRLNKIIFYVVKPHLIEGEREREREGERGRERERGRESKRERKR